MPESTVLPSGRPAPDQRRFHSEAVEAMLEEVTSHIPDPELAVLFSNCFPNTLDTTVDLTPAERNDGVPDTYVITGDIDAMWLRDSSAQVNPYLPLCSRHDLRPHPPPDPLHRARPLHQRVLQGSGQGRRVAG